MRLTPSAHVDTFCRDGLPPLSQWPDLSSPVPDVAYPDRLNCAVTLLTGAIEHYGPDRLCLASPTERWTYGDVLRTARRIGRLLTEHHGLVPGNRVLLRGPNSPWLALCWLGLLTAGCVAVTTMPLLRARELAEVHDVCRIDLALCDHRYLDELRAGLPGTPVLAYGGASPDDLVSQVDGISDDFEPVRTAADDVALLAFTSGTTGRPKATMHFHRDVLAVADTFSRTVLRPTPDDLFTGTPPLGFTFGLGGLLIFPLRAGAAVLLLESPTPDQLAGHIADHGATVCFSAPTAYRAMLASGAATRLRGLRRAVSAGEHLPASTWHEFRRTTGVEIINGLGTTELLHIVVSAADEDIRPGATGRPVPGFDVAILDEAGRPVPTGRVGRLAVRGPTGCRYLADDRQRDYVRHGWNITGDSFRRDADGYLWYQARTDDLIVSAGYKIAGPEVEEALLAHPDVVECGVVGVPDELRGTLVTACVVLREGVAGDQTRARELQEFVKHRIAPYKYPRRIEFMSELPRTSSGKLRRFALRDVARGVAERDVVQG
ncbi:2-aminobenzoate-CoA ligase [Actinoalloteichus hoggarensis]|uniref:Benzoate--CoA ligase n=1 Tax=Actinoalloteichus hoggarensis TaxID=1470176 RepID=A0A221W4T5_9PSEU|nr:AMP-binding protein [Actinoalloteichus hoggarensis]ASO20910.1 Benzoate--CoA ligase [Actinoalloteichus hoggarensis]MBB5920840.1 2-aminobenzoate-CoA ligase [Actinoalloteichus hoggarensis]